MYDIATLFIWPGFGKMINDKLTFDFRDEYQRRPIAEKVVRLLTQETDVSPMVIDGGWGSGKTEFCHKLMNLLQEKGEGYQAVYVDAFKSDHADSPLMTLIAAVLSVFSDEGNEKKRD